MIVVLKVHVHASLVTNLKPPMTNRQHHYVCFTDNATLTFTLVSTIRQLISDNVQQNILCQKCRLVTDSAQLCFVEVIMFVEGVRVLVDHEKKCYMLNYNFFWILLKPNSSISFPKRLNLCSWERGGGGLNKWGWWEKCNFCWLMCRFHCRHGGTRQTSARMWHLGTLASQI